MPARKSAPKPKKPKTKPTAAPHGPSEGKDKPARRKAQASPAKKAPAKKAAPARKPRGAAASKAEAPPVKVAAQLLAKPGAPDAPQREKPLTPLDEAFLTEYMRNGMNGTAAWRFVHPGVNPVAAASAAYAALRKPQMAARVEAERKRMAKRHELTRDQLLAEFLAIARADPNELVQMRAVACKTCWGGTAAGQSQWTEPDPECPDCMGDGNSVPWIADTRKLSPEARALYAGIQQTKEGIKVLMHDKVAALTAAGRIIGAFEKDNEQKTKGVAEAAREFFALLQNRRLPIAKTAAAPPAPPAASHPLVRGEGK